MEASDWIMRHSEAGSQWSSASDKSSVLVARVLQAAQAIVCAMNDGVERMEAWILKQRLQPEEAD